MFRHRIPDTHWLGQGHLCRCLANFRGASLLPVANQVAPVISGSPLLRLAAGGSSPLWRFR